MKKLCINDLVANQELDLLAMRKISGGSSAFLTVVTANTGASTNGPGGPRRPEDQIIFPENPYDIIDMI